METMKNSTDKMVWMYARDDRQQTTEEDIQMDAKTTGENEKIKANLDEGHSADNDGTRNGGWETELSGE